MDDKRNRIIKLTNFLKKSGIEVNVGKTKARGNKGIFMTKGNTFRIDVAKNADENSVLSVLLHEYGHFLHYKYDKTLNSFKFIFPLFDDRRLDELLNVSVQCVSKDMAASLFDSKKSLSMDINDLAFKIKQKYPNFRISVPYKKIESTIKNPYKYLLKYDAVRLFNGIISISSAINGEYDLNQEQLSYITLKSKQRLLKRINSKISRLNKYYNRPTELIARFFERYFLYPEQTKTLAPLCCSDIQETIKLNTIPELKKFYDTWLTL